MSTYREYVRRNRQRIEAAAAQTNATSSSQNDEASVGEGSGRTNGPVWTTSASLDRESAFRRKVAASSFWHQRSDNGRVMVRIAERDETIETPDGPTKVNQGDYIVVGVDLDIYAIDPKTFLATHYEPTGHRR